MQMNKEKTAHDEYQRSKVWVGLGPALSQCTWLCSQTYVSHKQRFPSLSLILDI